MPNGFGIVTGASRGLGASCAEELAAEGYDLIITYTSNKEKAEAVKQALHDKYQVRTEIYKLNVQNVEEVEAFYDWVQENYGDQLSVLINNAGIIISAPPEELTPKEFDQVIDVNLKGTFYMCHYFCRMMIKNHYGKIINMCSAVGLRASAGSSAYASSKFGVRGLTQALAIDLGKHNIQVNAIAPGAHKTDMFHSRYDNNPELYKARVLNNPLQRAGEVVEMQYLVRYFMASDYITGQVVSPNGGTTMI